MRTHNVLLIGGGGREHALASALKRSPRLQTLWISHPSNPGLAELGNAVDVPVDIREVYRLRQFCDHHGISLVVIGPEDPLAEGYVDALASESRLVFGPSKAGAMLEADKSWAKHLMRAASIPTADSRAFDDPEAAEAYVQSRPEAPVVKASGLAKGKGVFVCRTKDEAVHAIDQIMRRRVFGDAGRRVIIEERLAGPEASLLALVDGSNILVLPPCQDHKRLRDDDQGPNTGGMGAFCPASTIDDAMMSRIEREIIVPTVDALRRAGIDYRGVLYSGLMLTPAGPKVLEFNVRFGDPECQPLMAKLDSDLIDLLEATATGTLDQIDVRWKPDAAVCVVLAADGYPEKPRAGHVIEGLDEAAAVPGVTIQHAGTRRDDQGRIVTAGGRVLNVTATGKDLEEARQRAYAAVSQIAFPGMQVRLDIGRAPVSTGA
ncbi:MAG: phosphoribosylamine--glycine ligase [Phycisphaerales bacterium]|nr:phosphoribosylamine--glycine ligase [Phycisphaerales bacterium]